MSARHSSVFASQPQDVSALSREISLYMRHGECAIGYFNYLLDACFIRVIVPRAKRAWLIKKLLTPIPVHPPYTCYILSVPPSIPKLRDKRPLDWVKTDNYFYSISQAYVRKLMLTIQTCFSQWLT